MPWSSGAWGIPVGLVSGDDALAAEVEVWLPWAERVIVKTTDTTTSATSVHPSVACDRVRAGAQRAVSRVASGEGPPFQTLDVGRPVVIELEFATGSVADHAAIAPGAERSAIGACASAPDDPVEAFRGFLTAVRLAGLVG